MVTVTDVCVRLGHTAVVNRASIQIKVGETVAVVGPNGAGKSTLGKAIAGLVPVHEGAIEGEITPDGGLVRLDRLPAWRIHRFGVQYVPAERPVFEVLTVADNLRLPRAVIGARSAVFASCLDDTLNRFPLLRPRLGQIAGTLSGGEKRILAIACVCLAAALRTASGQSSRASLLILDEPTHGLSPIAIAGVTRAIRDVQAQGASLLLIEQNVVFAAAVAERGYVMNQGRITAVGSMDRLTESNWATSPDESSCQQRSS